MDSKDVMHIVATLTRAIGSDKMTDELDAIGWRSIAGHPVEYFQGYLAEWKDNAEFEDKVDMIKGDINRIANLYGLKLNGDEFVSIAT